MKKKNKMGQRFEKGLSSMVREPWKKKRKKVTHGKKKITVGCNVYSY